MNMTSVARCTPGAEVDAPTITVGYDGSDASCAALRWAASESMHRGGILRVVTCAGDPPAGATTARLLPDPRPVYEMAEWLMQSQSDRDRGAQTEFNLSVVHGPAEERLTAETSGSDLLVIGSAGHLVLGAWRLGSITHEILRHAVCPVVLVPAGHIPAAHGKVVVGVEDLTSRAALVWAAGEARRRHAELVVAHARSAERGDAHGTTGPGAEIVAEAARFAADHHDGRISTRLVAGPPANSLLELAYDADLLVVGVRTSGHGDGKPGSIARTVGACATSPTVIVQPVNR
jgi:nucleotide-binding universal stress UspA family protein